MTRKIFLDNFVFEDHTNLFYMRGLLEFVMDLRNTFTSEYGNDGNPMIGRHIMKIVATEDSDMVYIKLNYAGIEIIDSIPIRFMQYHFSKSINSIFFIKILYNGLKMCAEDSNKALPHYANFRVNEFERIFKKAPLGKNERIDGAIRAAVEKGNIFCSSFYEIMRDIFVIAYAGKYSSLIETSFFNIKEIDYLLTDLAQELLENPALPFVGKKYDMELTIKYDGDIIQTALYISNPRNQISLLSSAANRNGSCMFKCLGNHLMQVMDFINVHENTEITPEQRMRRLEVLSSYIELERANRIIEYD